MVASLAVDVCLCVVRVVLSEDILAPSIRPSCGNGPHGFCACIRFSESSSVSCQYNREAAVGGSEVGVEGMKVEH